MKVELAGRSRNRKSIPKRIGRVYMPVALRLRGIGGGSTDSGWIGSNYASILVVKHAGRSRAADGARVPKKRTMQFNKGNNVKSIFVFRSLERTYI